MSDGDWRAQPAEGAAPAARAELVGQFWRLVNGLTGYFAVLAAEELGVFGVLADAGPSTTEAVAEQCGAGAARLRAVLAGNVAAGTLRCHDGMFELTELAATHLVRGLPGYLGPLLRHSPGPFENWPVLAATVCGAAPPRDVGQEAGSFLVELVQATYPVQLSVARAVVDQLDNGGDLPAATRVLDLGAGAAPWSIAVLERLPGATAVVNDIPAVVPLAEHELVTRALRSRVELAPGSYFDVGLPAGAFDLVALGHVCRAEGDA
ncbi:MAG: methyltransferase family protein, partial [Acidimicrobiales bacterium]